MPRSGRAAAAIYPRHGRRPIRKGVVLLAHDNTVTAPPGTVRLQFDASPDTFAAIQNFVDFHGVPVGTAEAVRRLVAYGQMLHSVARAEKGLCLISVHPDGTRVAYLRRPTPGRRWWNFLTPRYRVERQELFASARLHQRDRIVAAPLDSRAAA